MPDAIYTGVSESHLGSLPSYGITVPSGAAASAAFTPTSITGLIAWYSFDDISTLWKDTARTSAVTADGDVIKGVTDKSGSGNHLSDATGGVYKTAIQNSRSVCRFAGASKLRSGAAAARTAGTYYLVMAKVTAIGAGAAGAFSFTQSNANGLTTASGVSATNYHYRANQAGANQAVTISAFAWHVVVGKVTDASTMVIYGDGTSAASFDPGDIVTTGTGWGISEDFGASNGDFDYGEVLVYNTAHSDANRNLIEANLKSRWGTP